MKNKEGVVSAIKVTLRNYKHSDPAVLVDIFSIGRNQCVIFLQRLRIQGSGVPHLCPLFCFSHLLHKVLSDALRYCDLNVSGNEPHSFRIGAASWAAARGMLDAQIRASGRLKANAFLPYIRTPSLESSHSNQ